MIPLNFPPDLLHPSANLSAPSVRFCVSLSTQTAAQFTVREEQLMWTPQTGLLQVFFRNVEDLVQRDVRR